MPGITTATLGVASALVQMHASTSEPKLAYELPDLDMKHWVLRPYRHTFHDRALAVDSSPGGTVLYNSKLKSSKLQVRLLSQGDGFDSPSPDVQFTHNRANGISVGLESKLGAGTLKMRAGATNSQVPNRSDLGADYDLVGRGYGFLGLKGPDSGLADSHAAGQRLIDERRSIDLTYNLPIRDGILEVKAGSGRSRQTNNDRQTVLDRFVASDSRFDPNFDSSLDYSPEITSDMSWIQAGTGWRKREWTFGVYGRFQRDVDSLLLLPGSQLALNRLASLDPRLVGPGQFLSDEEFFPLLDELGNQVYALDSASWATALKSSRDSRHFGADLTYGNRYKEVEMNSSLQVRSLSRSGKTQSALIPSLSVTAHLPENLRVTAFANGVWDAQPIGLGELFGVQTQVTTGDTYGVRFDWGHWRGSISQGRLRDYVEWRSVIPGSQIGAYLPFTSERAFTREASLSYIWSQSKSFFSFNVSNRTVKLDGLDSTGIPTQSYAANDELVRLGVHAGHRVGQGWATASLYHGSGTASSDILGTGARVPSTRLDIGYQCKGFVIQIQNLLNERALRSWNAFPGTTFAAPRRLVIGYSKAQ